ncbi:hypothetical protein IJS77_05155 [bacterium]|nr:hypothetical protein [bacterium]
MIGKTGMTPSFGGKLEVACRDVENNRNMITKIDTKNILAIKQDIKDPEYTNIVTYDFNSKKHQLYMVPKTYASKQDIIAAYAAAKDADIVIQAINI